jgi:hypothetical protein
MQVSTPNARPAQLIRSSTSAAVDLERKIRHHNLRLKKKQAMLTITLLENAKQGLSCIRNEQFS